MVLTQQRTLQAEGFSQIISYVLVFVALVEGAAWAAFGVSFWSKAVFIAWAVAMVWTRPWLVNTRILALAHGNEKLAASAATWLRVSLAITAFSLFSLYSEAMETYKNQRIAESAPVLAAASRLEQAEAGLQRIKEGATVDDAAILSAVATNTRLQTELEAARQKAQAAFAAQQAAVQRELDAFWIAKMFQRHNHPNSYIMTDNCTPLNKMRSDAQELCPRLQAIQRKMPNVAADPEVRRIETELAALAPALSLHSSMESAKLAVSQAEEALHGKQSTSGIASADVYPPVFHRLANLTSGNVTADNLVSVFGLLGILLLLFSLNLFQEARLLCMQDADGHIRQDAATEAQSWLSRLMFWRQDKQATGTNGKRPGNGINNNQRQASGIGRPSTGITSGQDDRYQALKQAIQDGEVASLSFGNLKKAGYGDDSTVRRYRDALVAEGVAEYAERGECVLRQVA